MIRVCRAEGASHQNILLTPSLLHKRYGGPITPQVRLRALQGARGPVNIKLDGFRG